MNAQHDKPAHGATGGWIGAPAPDFVLPRDGAGVMKLADFRGRKLVLYFYPKDDTSGCTVEARAFNALLPAFEKAGAAVVGVSPDAPKKHDAFKTKYDLAQPLLSDESKTMLAAYGVWVEKSMYGRTYMGVARTTFLIDERGIVRHVWEKVKTAGHAEAVLARAQALA